MNTHKNFVLGASTGIVGLGIKTLLNIIVYPYILQKLGVVHYGLYVLFLNLVDLIILIDIGLTSGIIQRLSTFRAQEAENDAKQLLSVGLILYAILAVVSFGVCFSLVPLVPNFFGFTPPIAEIANFCLYIILMEGSLTLFQGYFSAVLMSRNLHQWVNSSETLYFIIANGGIFVLLHLGYGLKEIALLRFSAAILKFLLVFTHAVRVDPACIQPFYFNAGKAFELLKISLHAMVRTVSDIFTNRMDLVLIGRFLGLQQVAIFEFVYRFLNIIMQIPVHLSNGVFPIFTRLKTLQDQQGSQTLFLRISSFIQFAMTALLVFLCIYYEEIFTVFAGNRMSFQETAPLLYLAIPGIFCSALALPAGHYLFASGRFQLITGSSVSTSLLKLILAILLIGTYGLTGVIFASLVTAIIYNQFLLIRSTCRDLAISASTYFSQVYLVNAPALIVTVLGLYLLKINQFVAPFHLKLHTLIGITCIVPAGCVLWFITTASAREKEMVLQAINRILPTGPFNHLIKQVLD